MLNESLQIRNCGNTTLESIRASRREQTLLSSNDSSFDSSRSHRPFDQYEQRYFLRDRARYISLPAPHPCEFDTCKSMHLHEDAIYTTTKLSKIISRLTGPKACSSCHPLDGKLVRQNDETASRSVAGVPQSGKKQSYGFGPKASTRRKRFFRCVIRDSRRSLFSQTAKNR